jgi:hypothetical protein
MLVVVVVLLLLLVVVVVQVAKFVQLTTLNSDQQFSQTKEIQSADSKRT